MQDGSLGPAPAPHRPGRDPRAVARLACDDDPALRDRLVLAHAPMVKWIAFRKVRELPAWCDMDDFISAGVEAILRSLDRFDPSKGATLEQFLWTRVHGAVLDELRKHDWAPRSVRRGLRAAGDAADHFTAIHGRHPTRAELADATGMTVAELRALRDDATRAEVGSLNVPVRADDHQLVERIDTLEDRAPGEDPLDVAAGEQAQDTFRAAFTRLPEREQVLAVLLYVEGLTLRRPARPSGSPRAAPPSSTRGCGPGSGPSSPTRASSSPPPRRRARARRRGRSGARATRTPAARARRRPAGRAGRRPRHLGGGHAAESPDRLLGGGQRPRGRGARRQRGVAQGGDARLALEPVIADAPGRKRRAPLPGEVEVGAEGLDDGVRAQVDGEAVEVQAGDAPDGRQERVRRVLRRRSTRKPSRRRRRHRAVEALLGGRLDGQAGRVGRARRGGAASHSADVGGHAGRRRRGQDRRAASCRVARTRAPARP